MIETIQITVGDGTYSLRLPLTLKGVEVALQFLELMKEVLGDGD